MCDDVEGAPAGHSKRSFGDAPFDWRRRASPGERRIPLPDLPVLGVFLAVRPGRLLTPDEQPVPRGAGFAEADHGDLHGARSYPALPSRPTGRRPTEWYSKPRRRIRRGEYRFRPSMMTFSASAAPILSKSGWRYGCHSV